MKYPRLRPRRLSLALLLALPAAAGDVEVHVIDVDQALSVYVQGPTGDGLLVDGGRPGDGTGSIVPLLQGLGVGDLEYSVLTHYHEDHCGGLDEVLNAGYKPSVAAYDRGDVNRPSNSQVTQYLAAVSGVRATLTAGQVIDLGGGATVQVLCANGQYIGGQVSVNGATQEENARSIAVVVSYGDFDCYIGGDVTGGGLGTPDVEGPAVSAHGQVEMAVPAHHGSNTSSQTGAVNTLAPSLVVHSAGLDNGYGHPTETTIKHWSNPTATRVQWCTTPGDTTTSNDNGSFVVADGHVSVASDGATFTVTRHAGGETVDFATFEQPGTPAGTQDVCVSELLVDPAGSQDVYGDWFELANVAGEDRDVYGMRFTTGGKTFTVASRVLLAPDERFVVGADGRRSRNGQVFLGLGGPWDDFYLSNGNDSLLVKTQGGATVEQVSWGASAIPVVPGVSAERVDLFGAPTAANFADASTAWAGGDLGTPGERNAAEPPPCPDPIFYGTGKVTSIGTIPIALWEGTPSLLTNDFSIRLLGAVPNKPGIGFYGLAPASIPFMGHLLYAQPPVKRLPVQLIDATGKTSYAVPIDATMPGTERYYQFWFRDPQHLDGTGVGLSSALEVHFCPLSGGGPPGVGDVVICEFMKDPAFVSDTDGEWVEVHNVTDAAIDIEGWILSDDGSDVHVIDNGGAGVIIPAGSYFVLGRNANAGQNGGIAVDYEYAGFYLGNGADEIVISNASAQEIDRIAYDDGILWPDSYGRSISLTAGVLDATLNDDPGYWCHSTTPIGGGNPDTGTPGAANDPCP